jgi:hypothetical protein
MDEYAASPRTVLLTLEDVKQWLRDKAALEEKIRADQQKIATLSKKLDAAALLMPEAAWREALSSYVAIGEILKIDTDGSIADTLARNRMTADLADLVNRATNPMRPKDMRVALESSGYHEQLNKNPNYLYTVISRLVKSGRISKHGLGYGPARLSSPEGEAEADEQSRSGINPELSMAAE